MAALSRCGCDKPRTCSEACRTFWLPGARKLSMASWELSEVSGGMNLSTASTEAWLQLGVKVMPKKWFWLCCLPFASLLFADEQKTSTPPLTPAKTSVGRAFLSVHTETPTCNFSLVIKSQKWHKVWTREVQKRLRKEWGGSFFSPLHVLFLGYQKSSVGSYNRPRLRLNRLRGFGPSSLARQSQA